MAANNTTTLKLTKFDVVMIYNSIASFTVNLPFIIVLLIAISRKRLQNNKRIYFILNRCTNDLIPFIICACFLTLQFEPNIPSMNRIIFHINGFLFFVNLSHLGIAYLTIAAIRLLAVCRPIFYRVHMNEHVCKWLIVIGWLFSCSLSGMMLILMAFVLDNPRESLPKIVGACFGLLYMVVFFTCTATLVIMIKHYNHLSSGQLNREYGSIGKAFIQIGLMMISSIPAVTYLTSFYLSNWNLESAGYMAKVAIVLFVSRGIFDPFVDMYFDPHIRRIVCCRSQGGNNSRIGNESFISDANISNARQRRSVDHVNMSELSSRVLMMEQSSVFKTAEVPQNKAVLRTQTDECKDNRPNSNDTNETVV